MMKTDQFKSLQSLIAQNLGVDVDAVTLEANLSDDLGADSMDALHLLSAVEQGFNLRIPEEKMDHIKTVSDLWNLIQASK